MNTILVPTHNPKVYLNVRPDEPDDLIVIREIWCEDVYHVHERLGSAKYVVDVGANIGAFTCFCLEMASKAKVMAIEPEPDNLGILRSNVDRVDPARCEIVTKAVSDYEGTSTIDNKAGGSRLGNEGTEVEVTTIDSLLPVNQKIDIMKIDIEGSEVAVILSMPLSLRKRVNYFCIEFDRYSGRFGEVIQILSETHKTTTLGAASRGAMIFAERY